MNGISLRMPGACFGNTNWSDTVELFASGGQRLSIGSAGLPSPPYS